MSRLSVAAAILSGTLVAGAPATESLKTILARATQWVEQSERDFVSIIADETYDQYVTRAQASSRDHRTIRSELLFIRDAAQEWFAVRNVRSYTDEGEPVREVPNSADRLTRELDGSRFGGRDVIRRLADEGARFNIGRIARNFNTPTLALQFLDDAHRWRFRFKLEGPDDVDGEAAWRISCKEREHPTLVKANYRDTELSCLIWSRASDGAVLRTSLSLAYPARGPAPGLRATVTVTYANDAKLKRMVPVRMDEQYEQMGQDAERISGVAAYTNFRVFETSARVIVPQ